MPEWRRIAATGYPHPALLASKPAAQEEYSRFLAAAGKDIDLPHPVLAACLKGKRILVSGGTGCIGAALMAQLARFEPACLVSVSRGVTQGWPRLADADYVHADIRDRDQLAAVFDQCQLRHCLPRGGAAGPRARRARGAPHGNDQRARHPQRDQRRRCVGGFSCGRRVDRQGLPPVFTGDLHRLQAGRRVAAVPGGGGWADRLLGSEVHPCHRQLDHPCPAAGLV